MKMEYTEDQILKAQNYLKGFTMFSEIENEFKGVRSKARKLIQYVFENHYTKPLSTRLENNYLYDKRMAEAEKTRARNFTAEEIAEQQAYKN